MAAKDMGEPTWAFWERYAKEGNQFPPTDRCPRCGRKMDGGFWMHLCSDTERGIDKKEKANDEG